MGRSRPSCASNCARCSCVASSGSMTRTGSPTRRVRMKTTTTTDSTTMTPCPSLVSIYLPKVVAFLFRGLLDRHGRDEHLAIHPGLPGEAIRQTPDVVDVQQESQDCLVMAKLHGFFIQGLPRFKVGLAPCFGDPLFQLLEIVGRSEARRRVIGAEGPVRIQQLVARDHKDRIGA